MRAQPAKLRAKHCHVLKETATTAQRVRLLELQRLAKERDELETQLAEVKMLTRVVITGKVYWELAMARVLSARLHPTHCNSGRLLLRRKKNKCTSTAPYMRVAHEITTGAKGSFTPRDSGEESFHVARRPGSDACQADRVCSAAARAGSRTGRRSRRGERVRGQIRKWRTREEPARRVHGATREHTEGTFGACTTNDQPLSTEEKSSSVRGSTGVDVGMKSQQNLSAGTRITPAFRSTGSGILAYPTVPPNSKKGEGAIRNPTDRRRANANAPRNLVPNWSTNGNQTGLDGYRERSMSRQNKCGPMKPPGGDGSKTVADKQTHASPSNILSKTIPAVAVSTPDDDNHGSVKDTDQEYDEDFEAISVHDSRGGSDSRPGDELHTPQDRVANQGSVEDKKQLEEKINEQCFVTEPGPDVESEEWDEWRSSQDGAEFVSQEIKGDLTTGQKWCEGRQAIQNGTRGKEPDGPSRRRWNQNEECRLVSDKQGSRKRTFGDSGINTNLDKIWVPISDGHNFSRADSWAVHSSCNDRHGESSYYSLYDKNSVLRTGAGLFSRQPDREDAEVPSDNNAYAAENVISNVTSAEGGWSLFNVQFSSDGTRRPAEQTWSLGPYRRNDEAEGSTTSLARQRVLASNEQATTGALNHSSRCVYRSESRDCDKVISSSEGSSFYYSMSPPSQNCRSEDIVVTRKLSSFIQRRQNKNTNVSTVQDPTWGITASCSSSSLTFDQAQSEVQAFRSNGKMKETEIDDAYNETLVLNIGNNFRRRDDLDYRRSFGESFVHETHREHGTFDVSLSDTLGENIVVNDTDHDNSVCADVDGRSISSGSNGSTRHKYLCSFNALQCRPTGKPCQEFCVKSALFTWEKDVENISSPTDHAERDETLDGGVGFHEKHPFNELASGNREVVSQTVHEDVLAVAETHGTDGTDVDRIGDGGRGGSTKNAEQKPQWPSNEVVSRSARKPRRDSCAGSTPNSSSACIAQAIVKEDPSDGGYSKDDGSIEGAVIDDQGSFDKLILADERPSNAIGDTSLIIEKTDGYDKIYCGEGERDGPVETTWRGYRGPSDTLRSTAIETFRRESRDRRTPDAPVAGAGVRAPVHAGGDIGSGSAKRMGHDDEVSSDELSTTGEPHGVPASGGVHIIKKSSRCEDALVGCIGSPIYNAVQDHQRLSNDLQFRFAQNLYQESSNREILVGAVKVATCCALDVGDGSQGYGRVESGGRTDQGSLELTITDQPYRSPIDEDVFIAKERFHGVDVPDSSAATSGHKGLTGKAEQNHRASSSELRSWSAEKLREGLLDGKLPFAAVEAKCAIVSGLQEGSWKQTPVETSGYDEKESFNEFELEDGSLLNLVDEEILAVKKEIVCDGAVGKTVTDGQDDQTGSGGLQRREPSNQLCSRSMGKPRRTSRNGGARIAQAGGYTDGKASGQANSRRRHISVHNIELNDEGSFDELSSADGTPGDPVSKVDEAGDTAVCFSGSSGRGSFAESVRQRYRGSSKEQQVQHRSGVNPLEEPRFGSALVDRAEVTRSTDTPRLRSGHYREGERYDSRGSFNDLMPVHRTPSNLIDHDLGTVSEGIRAHTTRARRAGENGPSQITERLRRDRTQASDELRYQVESNQSHESREDGTPGALGIDMGGAGATSHTRRDRSSNIVEELLGQKSTSEDVFDLDLIGEDVYIIAEDKCDGNAALVDAEGGGWGSLISKTRPNSQNEVVAEGENTNANIRATDGKASGQADSRRRHISVHNIELNDEGSFDELSSADGTPGDPVSKVDEAGDTAVCFSGSSGRGSFAESVRQRYRGSSKEQQVQHRSGANPLEEPRFGSALVDRAEVTRSTDTPRLRSGHYREGERYDSRGSFNDLMPVHRTPSNLIDHDLRTVSEGIRAHTTRARRAKENGPSQITERLRRDRTQASDELRYQVESHQSHELREDGTPGALGVDMGGAGATSHTRRDRSSNIFEELLGQKSISEDVFDLDLIGEDVYIIAEDKCDGNAALVEAEGGGWGSLISKTRPNSQNEVVAEGENTNANIRATDGKASGQADSRRRHISVHNIELNDEGSFDELSSADGTPGDPVSKVDEAGDTAVCFSGSSGRGSFAESVRQRYRGSSKEQQVQHRSGVNPLEEPRFGSALVDRAEVTRSTDTPRLRSGHYREGERYDSRGSFNDLMPVHRTPSNLIDHDLGTVPEGIRAHTTRARRAGENGPSQITERLRRDRTQASDELRYQVESHQSHESCEDGTPGALGVDMGGAGATSHTRRDRSSNIVEELLGQKSTSEDVFDLDLIGEDVYIIAEDRCDGNADLVDAEGGGWGSLISKTRPNSQDEVVAEGENTNANIRANQFL